MWLSVGLLAYIFTQYHQKKEEKRRKHLAGSPGRVLCCGTKKRYPEGRRSFCLGMDWDVWSESCYCCCLPGGFQAVSRVSIETVATLVSAEKTIYRNCDKNVINSNATALHFIIIHFTATPLQGYLSMGIFSSKQNNIWFPLVFFFPPSSACFWIIQKASS